jgi:3-methylfumaryl-CoA hydratase
VSDPSFQDWVGREQRARDVVSGSVIQRLAALLDHVNPPWPEDTLPPLGHWLHFAERVSQSAVGPDGHARRGDFLPPIDLPRRMWAGSAIEFLKPIRVGEMMERRSTIAEITRKQGRAGPLVFVRIDHEISAANGVAIREAQDLVYQEKPVVGAPVATSSGEECQPSEWQQVVRPDAVLLFRYSALTYNSHRIHYDAPYATAVEGYPGLVVHGPLIATLLLDLFQRHHTGAPVAGFRFRAYRPLFAGEEAVLSATSTPSGATLCAGGPDGRRRMTAEVTLG